MLNTILFWLIALLACCAAPLASANNISSQPIEVEFSRNSTGSISISVGNGQTGQLEVGKKNITFIVNGLRTSVSLREDALGGLDETLVRIEDYNFDGQRDFAISTISGYGGVNIFFDVFLIDPKTLQIMSTDFEVCNPKLHAPTKSLVGFQCKSGLHVETSWYHYNKNAFLLWASSKRVAGGYLKMELVTGQVVISEAESPGVPVVKLISRDGGKKFAHSDLLQPLDHRLNSGQQVVILDVSNEGMLLVKSPDDDEEFWINHTEFQ